MKIKLSHAQSFLNKFNYSLTTIQVFPDKKLSNGKGKWPSVAGKILATVEEGSSAISYTGDLIDQNFKDDLILMQQQSLGIFFMVNEGDGGVHGRKIPRNSKAVTKLKALFVDTDNGDIKNLKLFCREKSIKPHIVVESSPGKFHVYFLLEETEATAENVRLWKACQEKLASIDPGFDSSMSDVSRVLRIPGFNHCKKDPFLVLEQEKYASKHKRYTLASISNALGAKAPQTNAGEGFVFPNCKIREGNRHKSLLAYLGYLSNFIRDRKTLICAGSGYAYRYFIGGSEWLPDGSRFSELRTAVTFVLEARQEDDLRVLSDRASISIQSGSKIRILPDEYFLKAPGIVGEIVRELVQYSSNPYPSFCFAAALGLVGALKAPYIRGKLFSTPPALYSMCLAESGRGKDFPRAMTSRVYTRLGFGSNLIQHLRSAQGFLRTLSDANGILLINHDECDNFFTALTESTNEYMRTFQPVMLQVFSRSNDEFKIGRVIDPKHDIPPIKCPCVNYVGFGVPTGFENAFQLNMLENGMLTRNLIFRDHRLVLSTRGQAGALPKQFKFESILEELVHDFEARRSRDMLGKSKAEIDAELKGLKTFYQVDMTTEAREAFDQYSEKVATIRNDASTNAALGLLMSRSVEQVNRMAVIMSDDVIDASLIEYCIPIVENCYENIAAHVESFNTGKWSKDADKALEFMAKTIHKLKRPVFIRDFMRAKFEYKELKILLDSLVEAGKIDRLLNYRKPGSKYGRKTIAYTLIEDDI